MARVAELEAEAMRARAREIACDHLHLEGPLLPVLHVVQEALGYLPEPALAAVAETLNISRAEVHGVASFYPDFRSAPHGRRTLRLCRAEACQAMGGAALAETVRARLGVDWGGTTPDGAVTLEPVYCLGLCACGPAALLDGEPVGRIDGPRLEILLAELRP
jgi:formate dehydrogenase subunit gamma